MLPEFWESLWLFLIALLTYAIKYLLNVFLANHLGASFYGDFVIALRCLSLFATIAVLGTTISSRRFLSSYLKSHDHQSVTDYIHWNLRLVFKSFLICLILAIGSFLTLALVHYLGIKSLDEYHMAVYSLWLAPIAALVLLFASFLASHNHVIIAFTCENLGKFLFLLALFVYSILFLNISVSPSLVVAVFFISFSALLVIEFFLLMTKMPFIFSKLSFKDTKKNEKAEKKWLQTSSRLILFNILFLVTCLIDLIILEIFSSNEQDVGFYSAILAIVGILWISPESILQSIKSNISHLIKTPLGLKGLQRQLNAVVPIMLSILSITALLIFVFAKSLLLHFGHAYSIAYLPLIISTIGVSIAIIGRPALVILIYSGNEMSALKLVFLEMMLMIIVGIPLTIHYNVFGISIAYTLSVLIKSIISIFIVKQKYGLKTALLV